MRGKRENCFVVIENGQLNTYVLDNKLSWEIGRLSGDNNPDIKLHIPTVSRMHGRLQNVDGNWFYMDYQGKNGTIYNDKQIRSGINGRIRPIALQNKDILIFGGGEKPVINYKTVWSMFVTTSTDDIWRVEDTKGYSRIDCLDGDDHTSLENPEKGTVIDKENGMAIYMGDVTYLTGNITIMGC